MTTCSLPGVFYLIKAKAPGGYNLASGALALAHERIVSLSSFFPPGRLAGSCPHICLLGGVAMEKKGTAAVARRQVTIPKHQHWGIGGC